MSQVSSSYDKPLPNIWGRPAVKPDSSVSIERDHVEKSPSAAMQQKADPAY
jgi:hypothetical protein